MQRLYRKSGRCIGGYVCEKLMSISAEMFEAIITSIRGDGPPHRASLNSPSPDNGTAYIST